VLEFMRRHVVFVPPFFVNFGQSHDLTASRIVTQHTPTTPTAPTTTYPKQPGRPSLNFYSWQQHVADR
jgi:hypothetical protein